VRLLAFSDIHRDLNQCARLVDRAADADVVIAAGDFASIHEGLEEAINVLASIERPTLLVPGNNETDDALREACAGWDTATVLHGEGTTIDGTEFFGLGAGVPITPWDWSFDLSDEEAATMLEPASEDGVFVLHSPPLGHADQSGAGDHLGSEAILHAIEAKRPRLAVCGHIHESWGTESQVGPTRVVNLGPAGVELEL
jgi:uncharacterized protein